jgi:hypothetical protein
MRTIIALLLMTSFAYAQTVSNINNATVNIQGANQNVSIIQSGTGNHTATVNSSGNDITVQVSQSGQQSRSIELNISCVSNCSSNPYIVDQH